MTKSRRAALLGVALVFAAGAYGVWHLPALFGPSPDADHITVSGNIEAHESVLSFTVVQAPIVDLPFDEGAAVTAGTVLARVDDRLYRQQTEIDRTNVQVAAAQVSVNESSLAAANSNVSNDRFDLSEKQREYARAEQLLKSIRSQYRPAISP